MLHGGVVSGVAKYTGDSQAWTPGVLAALQPLLDVVDNRRQVGHSVDDLVRLVRSQHR